MTDPNTCDCCEGVTPLTPVSSENPPGQAALAYRVGTHGQFKASMQSQIAGQAALSDLTTRDDDDASIALIDAWATTLDVLTFYQERIANEAYLRTSTERQSILELARSIGYELRPGVAASTYLAFELETAAGAPEKVMLAIGTKAQTIPGQDELPQTFETIEAIEARPEWNKLRPRQTEFVPPKLGDTTLFLQGTSTNLKPGDALLVIGDERMKDAGNENWDFRRVATVTPVALTDSERSYTIVTLNAVLGSDVPQVNPAQMNPKVYALRQRASIFGHNAPEWRTIPDTMKANYLGLTDPLELIDDVVIGNIVYSEKREWPDFTIFAPTTTPKLLPAPDREISATRESVAQAAIEAALAAATQASNAVVREVLQAAAAATNAANSVTEADKRVNTFTNNTDARLANIATEASTSAEQTFATANSVATATNVAGKVRDLISEVMSRFPPYIIVDPISLGFAIIDYNNKRTAILNDIPLRQGVMDGAKNAVGDAARDAVDRVKNIIEEERAAAQATAAQLDPLVQAATGFANTAKLEADAAAAALGSCQTASIIATLVEVALNPPAPLQPPRDAAAMALLIRRFADAAVAATAGTATGAVADFLAVIESIDTAWLPIAAVIPVVGMAAIPSAVDSAKRVQTAVNLAVINALKTIKRPRPARRPSFEASADTIDLDALYPKIVAGRGWLVLSSSNYQEVYSIESAVETARAEFGLSGKTTRVQLKGENYDKFTNGVRTVNAYAESELLKWAEQPIGEHISGNSIVLNQTIEGLSRGQPLIVSGTNPDGEPFDEVMTLNHTELENGFTKLVFSTSLEHIYQRASVIIQANVARATHGETKTEVLGSGDASQPFQKFVLKQAPLTYIATDQTPSGAITSLAVRVNDVLWTETPSLYGLGKRDRDYVTRTADDDKVTVMFGDGQSGARLPTGVENVKATYRVGTGLAGMVKAKQISLLMTRPLGAKGVINPLAPEGAQDPETRDSARQNAPLTVLTLDRVVSLQDFEDFARAFGGIGKAQAVWLWDGERRIVHVTVAAANGDTVPQNSKLQNNLRSAITAASDPTQHFQIDSYTPLTFKSVVKVKIDDHFLSDKVVAAISSAVTQAFSFQARNFGQPVTASELIALIQRVAGVVYVDLDSLQCVERPTMKPPLIAQIAHWENKAIKPAELLTLSTTPNSLQVIPI